MVNIQTIFVHEKGTQSNTVGELENLFLLYFNCVSWSLSAPGQPA